MLAVTDGGKDMAIVHGSSVRRDGDVWFSSLAKLNVLASGLDSKDARVEVNGQPRMRFSLRPGAGGMKVNGTALRPDSRKCYRIEEK